VTENAHAGGGTPSGRGSDRPALLVAAVALVAVVVLSAVVGFIGAPHWEDFSWEIASIFGTALGTTLLAAATGWLAWSTRSEVRATQDLAELTRRQQTASERPVILLQNEPGWSGSGGSGVLNVDLKNVGVAPALYVEVEARYDADDLTPSIGSVSVPFIEAGSGQRVDVPVSFPDRPGGIGGSFQVEGTYRDRSMLNIYEIITSPPVD
jgi:hypothetical protein